MVETNYPSGYVDIKDDPLWDPVKGYIDTSKGIPPLKAPHNIQLSDFYTLCYNVLKGCRDDIRFVPAYPNEYLSTIAVDSNAAIGSPEYTGDDFGDEAFSNTVTYRLIERQASGAGPGMSSKRKCIKPRLMEYDLTDPMDPDFKYKILGQEFDNIIQFDVFSKTNFEVEKLWEWFDNFLLESAGYFKMRGISEMIFDSVAGERPVEIRNDIPHRSLRWFIKTQKIIPIRECIWKRFDIQVNNILPDYK